MRNELRWALAALAVGVLAVVGFAVAAAARGDGGEAELRAIRVQTDLAPGRDIEFSLELPERPALPLLETLRARPFVGVTLAQTDEGVEIVAVIRGSAAAEADLRKGDVIRAIDGEEMDSVEAVVDRVRDAEPGDELTFTVERDGKEREIEVRLGDPARFDLSQGTGGIWRGRVGERLRQFDLEELLPQRFPRLAGWVGDFRDHLDEALERFISAEVRYLDEEGKLASLRALGGTVSSIDLSKGTLSVAGNEREPAAQTFDVTDDTRIRRDLRRAELADIQVNERVVIIAVGEGNEAAVVLAFSPPEES
jgi:membrane-associated protease RseP (regulator of RpoE activity)